MNMPFNCAIRKMAEISHLRQHWVLGPPLKVGHVIHLLNCDTNDMKDVRMHIRVFQSDDSHASILSCTHVGIVIESLVRPALVLKTPGSIHSLCTGLFNNFLCSPSSK